MSEDWYDAVCMFHGEHDPHVRLFGEDKDGNRVDVLLTPGQAKALEDMEDRHHRERRALLRSFAGVA